MKNKTICALSLLTVVLQLVSIFIVCYMNQKINDTSQMFLVPIISAFMFSAVPLVAVKALKSIISEDSFPRVKSVIILTVSVILAVTVSLVWINFVLTILRIYDSNAYIFKTEYIDELIMFFPVVSVLIQFVLFLFAFMDIKIHKRKGRKKTRIKKGRSKDKEKENVKGSDVETSSVTEN